MADHELMRVVFGIIANVISIGLFTSAVPTFYRAVKKKKSMEDIKPYYYLAMTFSCLLLVLYGLPFIHPGNILLLTAYGTGVAINIAYLAIFLLYANKQRMHVVSILLIELLVIGLVFGLVVGLGHTFQVKTDSLGPICLVIGVVMLTPRARLTNKVQDKKSVECMPFFIALSDTLNGLCWCIYAILGSDNYFMTPNLVGCGLGLYQLILYCLYRSSSTPKSCDDEKLAETAEKELPQAEHDKKLSLQLKHDEIKQALNLAQAQVAQFELELAELGPVTGPSQVELEIV